MKSIFIIILTCIVFAGCSVKEAPIKQGKSCLIAVNFWGAAKLSDGTEVRVCSDASVGDTAYYSIDKEGKVICKKISRTDPEELADFAPRKLLGVILLALIALTIIVGIIACVIASKPEKEKPRSLPEGDLYF